MARLIRGRIPGVREPERPPWNALTGISPRSMIVRGRHDGRGIGQKIGVLPVRSQLSCVANGARSKAMVHPPFSATIAGLVGEQYT